jgi:hypothetical protein
MVEAYALYALAAPARENSKANLEALNSELSQIEIELGKRRALELKKEIATKQAGK